MAAMSVRCVARRTVNAACLRSTQRRPQALTQRLQLRPASSCSRASNRLSAEVALWSPRVVVATAAVTVGGACVTGHRARGNRRGFSGDSKNDSAQKADKKKIVFSSPSKVPTPQFTTETAQESRNIFYGNADIRVEWKKLTLWVLVGGLIGSLLGYWTGARFKRDNILKYPREAVYAPMAASVYGGATGAGVAVAFSNFTFIWSLPAAAFGMGAGWTIYRLLDLQLHDGHNWLSLLELPEKESGRKQHLRRIGHSTVSDIDAPTPIGDAHRMRALQRSGEIIDQSSSQAGKADKPLAKDGGNTNGTPAVK